MITAIDAAATTTVAAAAAAARALLVLALVAVVAAAAAQSTVAVEVMMADATVTVGVIVFGLLLAAAASAEEIYPEEALKEASLDAGVATRALVLESDLVAVLYSDPAEVINSAAIDSDVVAVINPGLDMIAVINSKRGAAGTSEGVTGAVAAGLVATDLVMALQDVVAVVS